MSPGVYILNYYPVTHYILAPTTYNGVCDDMDFTQVKGDARRARLAGFCEFSWYFSLPYTHTEATCVMGR